MALTLGWADCPKLGGVAWIAAHMDFPMMPRQRLSLQVAGQIAGERANRNQALALRRGRVAATAHNLAAVSGTLPATGHYIGVGVEAELAAESAHVPQMSWAVSRRNSSAGPLSGAGGSQWGRLKILDLKQLERKALYKSEPDTSARAQRTVEWGRNKQGLHMTELFAGRRAFVPKLASDSLRQKASWIVPSPSPSPPKR